jgi:hypothetical protein
MSQNSKTSWLLIPRIGIEYMGKRIALGDNWETVSQIANLEPKDNRYIYKDVLNTGCSLMLDFTNDLIDIMFVGGSLLYEDIELFNTTWEEVKAKLIVHDMRILKFEYGEGFVCPELCIYMASDSDVGGSTDEMDHIGVCHDLSALGDF